MNTGIVPPSRFLILLCILVFTLSTGNTAFAVDRLSPAVTARHYIEPAGDGPYPCNKNNPCDFYTAYIYSAIGDIFIFKAGTYQMADMGYSSTPYSLLQLENKMLNLYGGWDGDPTLGVDPVIDPSHNYTFLDGENQYRIISLWGADNYSIIDGFRMTNGYAENAINTHCTASGAAGSPACGGAIYVVDASPTIRNNWITSNIALDKDLNTGIGGGIYAYNSPGIKIINNQIYANSASSSAYDGIGGGVYLNNCGSTTEISRNTFFYNWAAQAPHYGWGAAVAIEFCPYISIDGNQFYNNNPGGITGTNGSALYIANSSLDLDDNVFMFNYYGSVVYLFDSRGNLRRNYFLDEDANFGLRIYRGDPGGGIFGYNNIIANHKLADMYVSGSLSQYANVNFYFTTISFNATGTADSGVTLGNYVNGVFSHGIIANHYYGFKDDGHVNGTITIAYNLMYNDYFPYGDDGISDGFGYVFNFDGNPLFVNPAAGNYHIQPGSAAIDKGPGFWTITDDFDHQRRPNNSTSGWPNPADLGADEYCLPRYLPIINK